MIEPITMEERQRGQRWAAIPPENYQYQDWLRGYEALVVQLEERLKIAEEALMEILISFENTKHLKIISKNARIAMDAVGKERGK